MKTYIPKHVELSKKNWWLVDLKGQILGRAASRIAMILRGKHKVTMTPGADNGDFVVITNADQFNVTGNKLQDKIHYWHTGYPGGIKSKNLQQRLDTDPKDIIFKAVKRMLPRGVLGRLQLSRLKIFLDDKHPYQAQKVKHWDLTDKGIN